MSSKSKTKDQTVKTEPWQPIQGHLLGAVDTATQLANNPLSYYPGSTVAPMSDYTKTGYQNLFNSGSSQQGLSNTGMNYASTVLGGAGLNRPVTEVGGERGLINDTIGGRYYMPASRVGGEQDFIEGSLRGDYLNSNPYLDKMMNQASNQIRANVGSAFAKAGRHGSGAQARAMAEQMGDAANNIYYQNYNNERSNQMQAANLAGKLAMRDQNAFENERNRQMGALGYAGNLANRYEQAYGNERNWMNDTLGNLKSLYGAQTAGALSQLTAGQGLDAYNQSLVDADVNRWNYNNEEPWSRIERYLGLLPTGYGQQTTPMYQNAGAGRLGGALSGAATGAQIGSAVPGIGTGVGAFGGALIGLLGGS